MNISVETVILVFSDFPYWQEKSNKGRYEHSLLPNIDLQLYLMFRTLPVFLRTKMYLCAKRKNR